MRSAFRLAGLLAVLVACGVLHAAPVPKDMREAAKLELGRLDGTWRVTSMQVGGVEVVGERTELLIEYKNGEFAWVNADSHAGKIAVIDPSRTPKEVDYTFKDGPDQGKVLKAIYKLDGDTLTDCFGPAGTDRPKEFKSTAENGLYLITYKRVKKED